MNKLGIEKENLPEYKKRIKENNLNGKAFLYTDNEEIKKSLGDDAWGLGEIQSCIFNFAYTKPFLLSRNEQDLLCIHYNLTKYDLYLYTL